MKFRAILSRSTSDIIKSKVMSQQHSQIVLDVYMTPKQFAELIEKYFEEEFQIEVKE